MLGAGRYGEQPARRIDPPALVALGFGLAGVAYRVVLLLLTVPGSNSDEAVVGLAAMHIAQGRDFPVYIYGQHYMGSLESYLAAPLFALFHPSWLLLRIPVLLLYAAFGYLMYRLTRRLYSPWLAAYTVGLLALGSDRVIRDQLTAVGGRPEIKVLSVLMILLAVGLGQRTIRYRWLGFAAFGLAAGVSVWDDWLVLPYLGVAVLLLIAGCWRDLIRLGGPVVLAAFGIGVLPLILDNLTAPPGQDSLSVFLGLNRIGGPPGPLSERLHGAILMGVPLASGVCRSVGCVPWQEWWGIAYLPLLLATAVLAILGMLRPRSVEHPPASAGGGGRGWWLPCAASLALAVAAAAATAAYSRSPAASATPLASARYLTVLQISLPAALWPLWRAAGWLWEEVRGRRRAGGPGGARLANRRPLVARLSSWLGGLVASAALATLAVAMLYATAWQIREIPHIRAEERRHATMAATAERSGIRHVYAEYWTCNRLMFVTRERIICAVLDPALKPGQDRYGPHADAVRRADRPAFIFASGTAADAAFRAFLARSGTAASVQEAGGYQIYQPETTLRP